MAPVRRNGRALKPYEVDEAKHQKSGIRVPIMLNRNARPPEFFAEYGGESFQAPTAEAVMEWAVETVERLLVVEWLPVIRVEFEQGQNYVRPADIKPGSREDRWRQYSRTPNDSAYVDSAQLKLDFDRFWLGRYPDDAWRKSDWEYAAVAGDHWGKAYPDGPRDERLLHAGAYQGWKGPLQLPLLPGDYPPGGREQDTVRVHWNSDTRISKGTAYLIYTAELWAGLLLLEAQVIHLGQKIREMVTGTKGLEHIALIGAGTLALPAPRVMDLVADGLPSPA